MRNVIVLGTGGCAAEVTYYINILGYIDYQNHLDTHYYKYNFNYPYLCDIDSYSPKKGEEVLIAVADIKFRRKMIDKLLAKNATIGSFVHYSSIVSKDAQIGKGIIVFPFCIIENYARVGDYNLLTSYSFISHDCIVGDNNFFSYPG